MRQEIATTVKMKMGTAFACPFDLVVGDTVRWIDSHKSFWEYTASAVSVGTDASGTITSTAHGLSDGEPIVLTDADDTGWTEAFPYYVINSTTNTFQIANYRGGSALTPDASYPVQYRTIQGKLFRVNSWKFIADGGNLAVEVGLNETATDLYNWDSGWEVAPTTASSITVRNPINVETPTNLTATSGTNVLYTRQDGTIGTRVKLTWDEPDDAYILWGGYAEIEYRPSPDITFTADHTTETFTATAHGFSDNDEVQVITSGTLPDGLVADKYYYINSSTANTFKLVEYRGSTTAVTIDDNGTGTHTVIPYEDDTWNTAGQTVGRSQQAYVTDVQDGADYDFRVKFKNGMGNYGDYAQILSHAVVGKTAAPGAPTNGAITAMGQLFTITWDDPSDLDFSHTEVYVTTASSSDPVADGVLVGNIKAGITTYRSPLPYDQMYFYGRSVDTTGNNSAFTLIGNAYCWFDAEESAAFNFIPPITGTTINGKKEIDSAQRFLINLLDGKITSVGYKTGLKLVNNSASTRFVSIYIDAYDSGGTSLGTGFGYSITVNGSSTKYVDLKTATIFSAPTGDKDGATIRVFMDATTTDVDYTFERFELLAQIHE